MKHDFYYERNLHPFGKTWEKWATLWCNWMFSIPKKENPSLDETGKYCSINQNDENVWFLTGTFGNIVTVKRRCTLPVGKGLKPTHLTRICQGSEKERYICIRG